MNPQLFVICTLGLIGLTGAQVPEGTPCYTPRDEYGICTNIKQCAVLIDLLKARSSDPEVRTYLRGSTCGYAGSTPIVCCPQQTVKSGSTLIEAKDMGSEEDKTDKPSGGSSPELPNPPDCGLGNNTNSRVVGGIPAKLGAFPWIVALGYRNLANPSNTKWLCGGSMITEKHILTAGHCVHNRNDLYLARVGEHDLYDTKDGANPEDIPLAKAKIHEEYNPTKVVNDIAILTLSRPPTNRAVWPVCLPQAEPYRSNKFLKYQPMIAGWGAIYFNGPSSAILQVATVPVVDNSKCKKAYENMSVIDDRILCAGWSIGGKDACQGDSGGPLMLGKPDGANVRFYQIGVVSYGFRCADADFPGVYTRVTSFIDWIRENLN